jgi:hypothetical protein
MGPVISAKQKQRVESYIAESDQPVLARGRISAAAPEGGFYVAPVIFGPCDPDSKIPQNEYTERAQYGTAFVFLVIVALIATASIVLRNKLRNRYKW